MVQTESLMSLAQSENTIKNIIQSPGSRNEKPTEFMVQYATKVNQRIVAEKLKEGFSNKLVRKGRDSIISSTVTETEKKQSQRASPSPGPGILKGKNFKSNMTNDMYLDGIEDELQT